jgi:hypothetical protein
MRIITAISFIVFFAIGCSKENGFKTQANNESNTSAAAKSVAKIPINDLGAGTFHGYTGGLYPGGLNYPTGSYAVDLYKICRNITPLDTFGNPSLTENGKVLFVSIGWSTCGKNMRVLETKTIENPVTNPKLSLLTLNSGGGLARLNNVANPDDPYWSHVSTALKDSNASYRQVQIIYLETEDSTKNRSFPGRPLQVKAELESCFRVFKQKFPNVKMVYLLARTATFGANQHIFNTEPCPYYFGWACKWAIEDQINGVAGTAYKGPNKVSPLITWGFYQWADSLPRSTDGFYWRSSESSDGLHANPVGQDTLATRFQNFLLTDRYAKKWYTK